MEKNQLEPIQALKEKYPEKILELEERSPKRYYILIDKKDILELVKFIFNDLKARFIIQTGRDRSDGIELIYHFSFDRFEKVVSIITLLDREKPETESISHIIKGAQWIERENQDLFGIKFLNHPDPRRFILADDWPEGSYPYRRK
jgi:Ni,Fe-hydrogenase III component G